MVMTSGDPPYNYVFKGPFRGTNVYIDSFVHGPSGILLEQGQFVITAEQRRFSAFPGEAHLLPDFNIYVHPDITPSGPYEPKEDGSTLGNEINPGGAWIVDHIIETRTALEDLFARYAIDAEYVALDFKRDWLNQLDPTRPAPPDYRHADPGAGFGLLTTPDESLLGGSGVLFGLDFGEVMFNPYPYFSNNVFGDIHNRGTFNIQLGPVWPAFQRTNGALVSLNGREPDPDDYGTSFSNAYDTSQIGNDRVRLDGYVFLPLSEYLVADGTGGGVHNFASNTVGFTFFSSSTRTVPGPVAALPTTRVFADTVALASGVYALATRNQPTAVTDTTIPSGLVSQWPPSGQRYPMPNSHFLAYNPPLSNRGTWYNNAEFESGYHVFDDTMWITDVPSTTDPPSGLVVISPFTSHPLWLRYADLTLSSGSGVLGGAVASAGAWGEHKGLERVSSIIYRVQDGAPTNGTTSAAGRVLFQRYNDSLDYLGQIETDDNPSEGSNPFILDMNFTSLLSEFWVTVNTSPGHIVWRFDTSFLFVDSAGILNRGTQELSSDINSPRIAEMAGINRLGNAFLSPGNATFSHRGSGIWDLDISEISTSGVVAENCRLIDFAPVMDRDGGEVGFCSIFDMQEVAGATHLVDGNYILCTLERSVSPFNDRLFLLRVEPRDDSNAPAYCVGFWDIKAIYDLGTRPDNIVSRADYAMLFKAVD